MIQQFDAIMLDFFGSLQVEFLTPALAFLSWTCNHGELWIAFGVILLIFKKTRLMGLGVLMSLLFSLIIGNLTLKPLIARTRPYDLYELNLLISKPSDYSFPSGHTMVSFAGAMSMLLRDKRFGIPAMCLAAVIAFSRLYFQVHFFTDVLAGIILGCLYGLGAWFILRFIEKKIEKKKAKV